MFRVSERSNFWGTRRETTIIAGDETWVVKSESPDGFGLSAYEVDGPEVFVPKRSPSSHGELVSQVLAFLRERFHGRKAAGSVLKNGTTGIPTEELVKELVKRGKVVS